jgi:hypothetical protein
VKTGYLFSNGIEWQFIALSPGRSVCFGGSEEPGGGGGGGNMVTECNARSGSTNILPRESKVKVENS